MELNLLELQALESKETPVIPTTALTQNNEKAKTLYRFTGQGLPKVISKKVDNLVTVLNNEVVNMQRLRECLAQGIPDEAAIIREYSWKLVLKYLPPEKALWNDSIQKSAKTYEGLVELFLPAEKFEGYPLILKKEHPRFKQLQEDYLLWQQIEKDTSRTHAEFSFFATPCKEIMIPYLTSARRQKFKLINGQNEVNYKEFLNSKEKQRKSYRYDYMTRILYIYARLNPNIQYVQGMNEILAPLFYLVNVGKSPNAIEEASCFYLFNNAISDILQLHIKDLDKSENGIYGKLNEVNQMLVVIQPMIWSRLEKLKIDPFFYCFRWVTLLYAQDFALFDTIRIWQSIFSVDDRLKYISYLAIGIIMSCKEVILNNDFTVVLQYMQNIRENVNINQVIDYANELYIEFKDKDFSQHAKKTKKALLKKEKEKKKEKKEKEEQKQKKGGFFSKISNFVGQYFEQ